MNVAVRESDEPYENAQKFANQIVLLGYICVNIRDKN
jgi:hypothetical protein